MADNWTKYRLLATFYLMISVILIVIIFFGYTLLKKWDYLNIKDIEIVGNQNLEELFLRNLSEGAIGENLLEISQAEIRQNYKNVVRIDNIKIHRKFPSTLQIEVRERIGRFLIKTTDNRFRTIDKNMIILDNNNFYKDEIFPIINCSTCSDSIEAGQKLDDELVKKFIDIHRRISEIDEEYLQEISEYYYKNENYYLVNSISKNTLILPKDNFREKFEKYLYLKKNNLINNNIYVDLRFDNQILELEEE